MIQEGGATLVAFEPFKSDLDLEDVPHADTLKDTLANADAVVLLVAHTQFCELDPQQVGKMMRGRIAIDTVGCWDPARWSEAGFQIARLGVRKAL